MKICKWCKKEKSLDSFTKKKNGDPVSVCSKCYDIIRNYQKNNPDRAKEWFLKKKYGITIAEYREMLEKQNHTCLLCSTHQDNHKRAFHVDHCHETGKVRGLLCVVCNQLLGHYEKIMRNNLMPTFDRYLGIK